MGHAQYAGGILGHAVEEQGVRFSSRCLQKYDKRLSIFAVSCVRWERAFADDIFFRFRYLFPFWI